MKHSAFEVLVLCAALSSCTYTMEDPPQNDGSFRLEASIVSPEARTALGGSDGSRYKTLWSEGDCISLNGNLSEPLDADRAGQSVASFFFKGSLEFPYNILYPGTRRADIVSMPAVQNYVAGGFDSSAMPMYSGGRVYSDVKMKHLCSLLHFSLRSDTPVALDRIMVVTFAGEALSGDFVMDKDADGIFSGGMAPKGDARSSVTLDMGQEGILLEGEPKDFFIAIPAGNYSKGLSALAVTLDGKAMSFNFNTKDGEHQIAASKVISFPTVTFEASGNMAMIGSEEELLAWVADMESYEGAVLLENLDMTGRQWTPIADFDKVLNGAGHTIKGLAAPFAASLSGTIMNLRMDSAVEIAEGERFAPFAVEMAGQAALLENCTSAGSIVYSVPSPSSEVCLGAFVATSAVDEPCGVISNCTNEADITVADNVNAAGGICMGGIAGRFRGTVTDAANHGNLRCSAASSTADICMGGCVGDNLESDVRGWSNDARIYIGGAAGKETGRLMVGGLVGRFGREDDTPEDIVMKIEDCAFDGGIEVDGPLSRSGNEADIALIGGLAGACHLIPETALGTVVISRCTNNGDMTFSGADGMNHVYAAGIAGRISADVSRVESCVNNGDIIIRGAGVSRCGIAGITGTYWCRGEESAKVTLCRNNGLIALYDGALTAAGWMSAGGIIANTSCSSAFHLTLEVTGCENFGNLDRLTTASAMTSASTYAGGIVGALGYAHNASQDYADITISDCVNHATIIFNQHKGYSDFIETDPLLSFVGGIAGMSHGQHGSVTLKCCENKGNVLCSCGTIGGIVGYAHSKTSVLGDWHSDSGVLYSINSGNVGELDLNTPSTAIMGSGHLQAGGIAGYIGSAGGNLMELCWNKGNVCGSVSSSSRPFPGGIVGKCKQDKAVIYCKNSGYVRNYKSAGKSTLAYSGIISGDSPSGATVSYCAIGGHIYRASGWVQPDATTLTVDGFYPYADYIYGLWGMRSEANIEKYPEETYYKGCLWWDGTSQLEWEK